MFDSGGKFLRVCPSFVCMNTIEMQIWCQETLNYFTTQLTGFRTNDQNEGPSHHIQKHVSIRRWVKDACWKIWLPEQLLHQTNRSVCLGLFSAADEHRSVGSIIRASWCCARGNWSPMWSSSNPRVLRDWDRRGETPGSSPATAWKEPSQ